MSKYVNRLVRLTPHNLCCAPLPPPVLTSPAPDDSSPTAAGSQTRFHHRPVSGAGHYTWCLPDVPVWPLAPVPGILQTKFKIKIWSGGYLALALARTLNFILLYASYLKCNLNEGILQTNHITDIWPEVWARPTQDWCHQPLSSALQRFQPGTYST